MGFLSDYNINNQNATAKINPFGFVTEIKKPLVKKFFFKLFFSLKVLSGLKDAII